MSRRPRVRRGDLLVLLAGMTLSTIMSWAVLPGTMAPLSPDEQEIAVRLTPPRWSDGGSASHLLGTDQLGRDIFSRIVYGARVSVVVGLSALAISGIIGVTIGLLAGYYGGRVDDWMMRIADVQLSIPYVLFAIAIIAVIGASTRNVVVVLAVYGWVAYARLVRGQTLSLREREFVLGYRAIGASDWRIMAHLLPNLFSAVIVVASLELAAIIMLEASLSFLGLGVQPPAVSWGVMLADGRSHLIGGAWWVVTFPGLAITATVLSVNVLADRLRAALDPRPRLGPFDQP